MDLFDRIDQTAALAPLSDRMRPRVLGEVQGQKHLLDDSKLLASAIRSDQVPSLIFWGPPGTGKTTLAQVIAHESKARFTTLSAVLSGVPEIRKAIEEAREHRRLHGTRTILFVDEIHRWSKSQQDALLPHVERGVVTLIGATTENPSFAINAALLSRARVFRLEALSGDDLVALLERALHDTERGLGKLVVTVEPEALSAIAKLADGDARRALDLLEALTTYSAQHARALTAKDVAELSSSRSLLHDKSGEAHYNVVSAFIKSLRGSDPDAALYWMMRMLEAGEDPRFVLRRLLIFASEDIGNADPSALSLCVAADTAFARLGMPEGMHTLGHVCVYLACAPKSNATYVAWSRAQAAVKEHGSLAVPMKLRNAPTQAMKSWGYGEGYRYPHDEGGGVAQGETYLPDELVGARYYEPKDSGIEARIAERLKKLRGG